MKKQMLSKKAGKNPGSFKEGHDTHSKWLPFLVLILSLLITFYAWNYSRKKIERDATLYFEHQIAVTQNAISHAIENYIDTLYDVQGLFMATGEVTRSQWTRFIDSMDIGKRFPGLHNLSFARYVPGNQKGAFEKRVGKELHRDSISIFPPGDRPDYFPVEFMAFSKKENLDFGFDIGRDPVRRTALEKAIRSGEPVATGKTSISSAKKAGFCIRLPLYRPGSGRDTGASGPKALLGVVSIVFSMDDFIHSVIAHSSDREIDFEIFDEGPVEAPRAVTLLESDPAKFLFYDDDGKRYFNNPSYHPLYQKITRLDVAGERWLLYYVTRPHFHVGSESYFPLFVFISGLMVSGLLFGMTRTLLTSQIRAIKIARAMTAELRESEEKFRSFTETASDAIVTTDSRGRLIYVNEGAVHISGHTSEELIGKHYSILIPERFRESKPGGFLRFLSARMASRGGKSAELICLRKDRSEIPVELSMTRWKNKKGIFFTAIIRDVTDRKKTEETLNQKNAFVQLLYVVSVAANESSSLEDALQTCLNEICGHMNWSVGHVYFKSADQEKNLFPSSIWYFDRPSDYVHFRIETEKTYLSRGEGLPGMVLERGEPVCMPVIPETGNFPRIKAAQLTGIRSAFAIPLMVEDEVVAILEFYSRSVMEPDASTLEVMAHIGTQLGRVVERKKAKDQLDFLATHDPLSHLPNRALFSDRLEHAIANSKRTNTLAAVLFVDLDQFKRINDTLGHTLGDTVLQEVAKRLQNQVRVGDTVARWGGDEFTLLFENMTRVQNLNRICQKVLEGISLPIVIGGKELNLSASIGVTVSPFDGDNAELLLKNADIAMYRAKEKGRNNFQFYSQEMSSDSSHKLELENQLRHATEKNQLLLYYQPFIDLKSEKIVGAEALIRWNHPTLGMIPPSKFIPLAEETGLIVPIGDWVLETACAQNKSWQEMGLPPLRVAVNLSARQFQRSGMVDKIKKALKRTGLSPQYLELELTESILMQKTDEMISTLGLLHEMGIHISIDDFGTGYSSLSYIKKFPIDTLKIDQSFVRDITTNKDDAALSTAIIAMAHSLNLKVIAEAVETAEQLEFFKSRACNEIQGYYISPPLPPEDFKSFLSERSLAETK